MHTHVHLVVVFTFPTKSLNKSRLREDIQNAEEEYAKLLLLLESSGLKAIGKPGRRYGEIVILVHSPPGKLDQLARSEQSSDFQHGVVATISALKKPHIHLAPSDRIRLIYAHLTDPTSAGGLGISPGSSQWKRVTGIYSLHDPDFDQTWVRSLTKGSPTPNQLDSLRDNYGEEVGLYFAFLATYTKSLIPIAVLGTTFHYLGERYSPFYSIVIVLWATFFAEYWAVCERKLAIRWGTYGSSRITKPSGGKAAETHASWSWGEDFGLLSRLAVSVTVLIGFVCALVALGVVVFLLEAFLAILYKGPGSQLAPVIPPIIFAAVAGIVLGIYRLVATRNTQFERHNNHSNHTYSLTIKRWVLTTIVSYFGVTLSAFIYMPFGQEILGLLHLQLFSFDLIGATTSSLTGDGEELLWEHDLSEASTKLNGKRMQTQMFAFLVTAQLGNAVQELVVPYVIRWFQSRISPPAKRKRSDDRSATQEEKLLERVNKEVLTGLDYDVFDDYCEMVIQFGYIAIWSSIWPLAPVMAFINNWLEGPSDAFKLTTHMRKPIPIRVESIAAWLDCIRWIAWMAAVVNTLLVYLYHPDFVHIGMASYKEADVKTCLLIALAASHAFLVVQYVMRVVVEKAYWRHSEEREKLVQAEQRLRRSSLDTFDKPIIQATQEELQDSFWTSDEGLKDILGGLKED